MCRKLGLKTAWKDWPGQDAGKNCYSEQSCQGSAEKENRRPAGKKGRLEGGRARALGGGGEVKDQQAFVWRQTPGSLLSAASEWHS